MPIVHDPEMNQSDENPSSTSPPADGDEEAVVMDDDPLEVIDLPEHPTDADIVNNVDELELMNDEEEEEEEGASAGPQRDDAQLIFTEHSGSVFCVHTDPASSSLVVTGGEDDTAYVWNLNDGKKLFTCTEHQDSVTCACFSYDSKYVATADMSGIIKVWKCETGKQVWGFEVGDLEWVEWHHGTPVLLAGTAEGEIWMWKIPSGEAKTFQSHGCTCNISKVLPDGKRMCSGYQDGTVKVWDLKTGSAIHTIQGPSMHKDAITSMDCHQDNNLVVTGSTDGTANLNNVTTGKVVASFNCITSSSSSSSKSASTSASENEETEDSVEAVSFSPMSNLLATGTLSGTLTLWDIPSKTARHTCPHEAGIVRLQWAQDSPSVFTAALDGAVRMWDARSGKSVREWLGHQEEILDMALTKDGKYIVTASGDSTARIFPLAEPVQR